MRAIILRDTCFIDAFHAAARRLMRAPLFVLMRAPGDAARRHDIAPPYACFC